MLEIAGVPPGSTAERLGLKPGDSILTINNEEINDVIDFQFAAADEQIALAVLTTEGKVRTVKARKDPDDTLGLEFPPLQVKRCRNKCIFCFVDQMPAGCRNTLYVRDDDFRASFLYGNFITLGALTEKDWARIFRQRLSPLYISVHSTDPQVRAALLRNRKAPDIMTSLQRLASGGIRMHTQIVLCPDINDGMHLARTIEDLSGLFPYVSSIAVVPVGLTRFRSALPRLRAFSKKEARQVIESIGSFAKRFRSKFGTRLVFPSDEFFIRAGLALPPASFYEDFPQIENGVGMVASFMREMRCTRLPSRLAPVTATIVTGASFSGILKPALERLRAIKGVTIHQTTVVNRFFGPSVTVTGLLTGQDILKSLKRKKLGDFLLLPSAMIKENERIFLDGMSIEDLEQRLRVDIRTVDGFRDVVRVLRSGREGKK